LACYVYLIVSLESMLSQWRNTIQPQQLMILTSQYSERAR